MLAKDSFDGVMTTTLSFNDANSEPEMISIDTPISIETVSEATISITQAEIKAEYVSFIPSTKTFFNPTEIITSHIFINGTPILGNLQGFYMDVHVPASYQVDTLPLTRSAYLDFFSIPPGQGLINRVEPRRAENGETIIRLYFDDLQSSSRILIPYSFSFADRITPIDYTIQPYAIFYDDEGNILDRVEGKEYGATYPTFTVIKLAVPSYLLLVARIKKSTKIIITHEK